MRYDEFLMKNKKWKIVNQHLFYSLMKKLEVMGVIKDEGYFQIAD